jgi:hypothetical protein
MTMPSRYSGFSSMDALLALLPVLLMIMLLMDAAFFLGENTRAEQGRRETLRKIISAADYTVKSGAAVHDGGVRYPNWLDEGGPGGQYSAELASRLGLPALYIGLAEPEGAYDACIYRIVVVGQEKAIRKLHVCGSGTGGTPGETANVGGG